MVRISSFGQARRARLFATVTLVALLAGSGLGVAYASSFSCPSDFFKGEYNKDGAAGSINDGSSAFEYKSWAWEKDNTKYICHCVRNLSANPTHIDWKEIGLSGWPRLHQTLFAMYSYDAKGVEKRDTTIEYGPVNNSKNQIVPTLYPKIALEEKDKLDKFADRVISAAYDGNDQDGSEGPSHLSIGRIAVPDSEAVAGMTDEEIEKYLADNNDAVSEFYMEFRSATSQSDGKITRLTFDCSYELKGDSKRIGFKIADPALQRAVFKSDQPVFADMWTFGGPMTMSGELEIEATSVDKIKTETSLMQIVGEDDKVLGSMPIVYFTGQVPK
ncbi:hypothetical protein [Rhizobium ruizarguesonis]|uniref:hypothetical protein n=1 Tax=Rhizobium ruizarguesonis TaxID=2081791 RepID=UPI00102FEFA5|nr:hypothetical protein [Rhizobium ruizarguesonis]TAW18884.1 hypothetical protein ELI25_25325 [Rhizobium ruizarguesonis]TAZ54561.1 hypothetical protein ELH76_27175 [Rhizobium ruizarguesonis]